MQFNRITEDGVIEELKGYDMHLEVVGEEDDYIITIVIGDDKSGIVVSLDAQDYRELKHGLMLANDDIVKKIREYRKHMRKLRELEKAAVKEFEDC